MARRSSGFISDLVKGKKMTYKGCLQVNSDSNDDDERIYAMFLGIPYAKAPVGERRFQPPEAFEYDPAVHGNPYLATEEKSMALQIQRRCIVGSEDCLYLNVYVPEREKYFELLPVLVYFHGGGFSEGSSRYDQRTPDSLLMHGILFVAVSYRLGPFGFLNMHTRKCKGNAGLKDQVWALKWVRDNIKAFGGNPRCVTICGESAGGSCVNFHLISPLSRNLFHRAIIQSGGIYCPWGFTGHQKRVMKHYKKYGSLRIAKSHGVVRGLKKMDAEDIVLIDLKTQSDLASSSMSVHMGPSIEKYTENAFLPPNIRMRDLMRKAKPIPILAGITEEEGYSFISDTFIPADHKKWVQNDNEFRDFFVTNLGWDINVAHNCLSDLRRMYYPNLKKMSDIEVKESFSKLCTDIWFHRYYENFRLGPHSTLPIFLYKFNYVTKINLDTPYRGVKESATHNDDIAYLYCPQSIRNKHSPFDETIKYKIKTMCSLWASFCKTGTPRSENHVNLEWRPHTEDDPCYLHIDDDDFAMKSGRLCEDRWASLKRIAVESAALQMPDSFFPFATTMEELRSALESVNMKSASSSAATPQPGTSRSGRSRGEGETSRSRRSSSRRQGSSSKSPAPSTPRRRMNT